MASRHFSRIVAMQILFEEHFRPKELTKIISRYLSDKKDQVDTKFIRQIVKGVLKNQIEIDKLIAKSAPEWPIDQIAIIDKTILRISIYELLFAREVPPKVAIDEAVELAKEFGGENSSKFVNGVLGSVYRGSEIYNPKEDKKVKNETR